MKIKAWARAVNLAMHEDGYSMQKTALKTNASQSSFFTAKRKHIDWPPQSPYCKPIELLWDELEERLGQCNRLMQNIFKYFNISCWCSTYALATNVATTKAT